jgi:hypothetical protein
MRDHVETLTTSSALLVRPYSGVDVLATALEMTQLVLDGGRYPEGSVGLPVDKLPFHEGSLEVYFDAELLYRDLLSAKVPTSHVRLAVLAYGSVVAESECLLDVQLEQVQSPVLIQLEGAPLIFKSPNGFDVRAFLYLAEGLEPDELRPYLPGTWLSFSEFRVFPQLTLSRFSPTPLDDDIRKEYQLPPECLTYVRVGDGIIEADSLDDEVDVFVDVKVLRLLQENPSSALAQYIQLDLAVSTLCMMLTRLAALAAKNGLERTPFLEESPAWHLFVELTGESGMSPYDGMKLALDDPGRLRALVETQLKALRTTSLALREVT